MPVRRTKTDAGSLVLVALMVAALSPGCGGTSRGASGPRARSGEPAARSTDDALERALGPLSDEAAELATEPEGDTEAPTTPPRRALLPIDPSIRPHAAVHFRDAAFVMRGWRIGPSRRGRVIADDQYRVRAEPGTGPPVAGTYTLVGFESSCVVRALRQVALHVTPQTRHDAATDQQADEVEPCPAARDAGDALLVALEGSHATARLSPVSTDSETYPGLEGFQRASLPSPFPSDWTVSLVAITELGPARSVLSRAERGRERVELLQIVRGEHELARFVDADWMSWALLEVEGRTILVATGDDGTVLFVGLDDGALAHDAWPFPMTEDYGN